VWATLTDESRLPHWFAGFPALSYPGVGTRRANPTGQAFIVSFPFGRPLGEVHGEYVVFSPPHRLAMRFREREKTSLVTYALQPEGQRTTLE
ncbi:SRPBCC family protein, partial [Salmonella sp. SAL4445]|uniref:SRPBCC family protein n=1 Tax=Salmonella sp. SAL4445 TaxID=3159900 RepID=UPI00397C187E